MEHQTQNGDNNNQGQANSNPNASTVSTTISRPNATIGYVLIPYTHGLAGSFKNTCGKYGIQTYFKGNTTIKQVLMKPKDQDPKDKKSGVIYSFQCNHIACNDKYMGRQQGLLGKDARSTLSNPLPFMHTYKKTGHNTHRDKFQHHRQRGPGAGQDHQGIHLHKGKQSNSISKTFGNNPTLYQNIGKYNLSHIWDRVLFNTPGL